MATAEHSSPPSHGASLRTLNTQCFFWGTAVVVSAAAAEGVMRHHDLPSWMRMGLSVTPVLPALMFARALRSGWASIDELQRAIEQQAAFFVIVALPVVFLCVDLLRHADLIPTWSWTTGQLALTMVALYAVGRLGCWWRYR